MSAFDDGKRNWNGTDGEELFPGVSKRRRTTHGNDDDGWGHRQSLSQHDYTFGWICALPIEMAAARAMLDNIHESLPTSPDDTNAYTFGNMGMHNIVIACLPSGHYGLNNAATVANNMRRSFPSIRFGLMVGIGGGVPGKVDVRLGDVVVSKEVVQYDFGKTVQDGHFQRTGTLNKPPQALMTAVAKLQADHRSESSKIPSILSKMLERHPSMIEYTHPGILQDQLFDGTYDHVQPMDSCQRCDVSRLVRRPARSSTVPKIHCGIIASANQVMKHGRTRDQLAEELDVLCFEMEAAGLMDSFPCLAIRGICDYSDSHKNKKWQEYAAATAAAYAKELLSVILTNSINQTQSAMMSSDADRQLLQERRIRLLGLLRFEQIHARRIGLRPAHDKTCRWLLEDPAYQRWLDPAKLVEHHGFLWIKGNPGVGKSTIMNFAYSHARKTMGNTVVVSFFFHARGGDLEKSIAGMYRSLLWELLGKVPKLQEVLDDSDLIPLSHSDCPTWETEVLRSLFSLSIAKLGQQRLLCFVDALDECDREEVYEMVEDFQTLGKNAVSKGPSLYICFSSRHYPFMDIADGQQLILEHQPGHEHDLEAYIYSTLKPGTGSKAQVDELRNEIRDRANGVFLWVKLVVQMLNDEYQKGGTPAIRKKRLQEIPTKLSDLFRNILRRDNEQPENLLLSIEWILYAKRPLKWEELYFALISGLHPDILTEWDPEETTVHDMKKFILSSSKGLAEITKPKTHTVQFIHESVRDFLVKENGLRDLRCELRLEDKNFESLGHDQLKKCCHTYIKLDITGYIPFDTLLPKASSNAAKDLRGSVLDKFPFLEYATRYVLYHADGAGGKFPQDNFLKDFALEAWIHLNNLFEKYEIRRHTPAASLVYILAENNLTNLIRSALRLDSRINIQGERYQYPLFAALANGHRDAVKALLQQETSVAQEDDISALLEYGKDIVVRKGQTPLQWAMQKGHMSLAMLLIASKETNPNLRDVNGRTPLSWAAEKGHEGVVALLLATEGIDANSKDTSGRTPLSWAAEKGHVASIRLLLANGADTEVRNDIGQTLLSWAAEEGHEVGIRLLLEKGADIEAKDKDGRTPLSWAAEKGHEGVVALLLATEGIDANSKDTSGRTPLSWAAEKGHEVGIRLLLEKGADIEAKDKDGRTPLSWAAEEGHEVGIRLLLEKGADIEAKDKDGRTPLSWAAEKGHEGIVTLLLAAEGINASSKDTSGRTPLSWAAEKGHEGVMALLLATEGVDANSKDDSGQTPLSWAAEKGHEGVIALLLATKGIDANSKDDSGQTPLFSAVRKGFEVGIRLLLEKGADIEAKDKDGRALLSYAVRSGHEAVTRLVLAKDAVINTKDNISQMTPQRNRSALQDYQMQLMLLEQQHKKMLIIREVENAEAENTGRVAVVQQLLEKGADVEAKDNLGRTPLSWAAEMGHEGVVALLLATEGIDANSKDDSGQTPLSWAAEKGHEGVIALLLATKGIDANSKDDSGQTPLFYALRSGYAAIGRLLCVKGPSIVAKDKDGRTPLSDAVRSGHKAVTRLFLTKDANVNIKDGIGRMTPRRNGSTPQDYQMQLMLLELQNKKGLMINEAEDARRLAVVQLLLEKGADIEAKDNHGQTILSWAAENGHTAVIWLLQAWQEIGHVL
ncbi:hypothetical protein BFJ70_g16644 [Fusarium oxysporum]|nr:hypothetical protein BFJ70_g16644 [Fusarium oxysporum]